MTTPRPRWGLLLDTCRTAVLLLVLVGWTGVPDDPAAPVLAFRLVAVPAALSRCGRCCGTPPSSPEPSSGRSAPRPAGWAGCSRRSPSPRCSAAPRRSCPRCCPTPRTRPPSSSRVAVVAYVPRPVVAWRRAGRVTRRVLGAGVPVVLLVAGVGGPAMAAPKPTHPDPDGPGDALRRRRTPAPASARPAPAPSATTWPRSRWTSRSTAGATTCPTAWSTRWPTPTPGSASRS